MSEPVRARDDAVNQWVHIFRGSGRFGHSHDRREWQRIADAIRTADHGISAATGQGARGDAGWCQVAVDAYAALGPGTAGVAPQPGEQLRCFADEHVIRAWLDGPGIPDGDRLQTVERAAAGDVLYTRGRLPAADTLTMLVDLAQDAGVFGIAGHRISLWRFFGDGNLPEHTFKISVRPPGGPLVTSSLIGGEELVPSADHPVAAIVGLLHAVAEVANQLLASRDARPAPSRAYLAAEALPVAEGVDGHPVGARGRAFPPLRIDGSGGVPDLPGGPPTAVRHQTDSYEMFVDESVLRIQLPGPSDRGEPAWIAQRSTNNASLPNIADVGSPLSPPPAESAGESTVDPTHLPRIGSPRPFPPPDRTDPTVPAPAPPAAPPTGPARNRHR